MRSIRDDDAQSNFLDGLLSPEQVSQPYVGYMSGEVTYKQMEISGSIRSWPIIENICKCLWYVK